jgi:NADH dehydrogenase FAD-containing subunit
VTLIDQSERFVFKPLLYELLNGTALADEVAPSFTQLLAPYPIQFIQVGLASAAVSQPRNSLLPLPSTTPCSSS